MGEVNRLPSLPSIRRLVLYITSSVVIRFVSSWCSISTPLEDSHLIDIPSHLFSSMSFHYINNLAAEMQGC
jgi:hypothetical protein